MFGDELADYHFGEQHPFGPKRYWAFKEEFLRRGLDKKVQLSEPQTANEAHPILFHGQDYINKVKDYSLKGEGYLDAGDTPAREGIYEAALTVVGTTLKAVDLIMQGNCTYAFTPIAGLHHASRTSAAGFCVFNDCGIAIEYLRHIYNIKRIAYIDIDAHHGDGVFYEFEDDADLCIVDFHQDGTTLFPGTGFINETGKGNAVGTKLNVPLPPGSTDNMAKALWTPAENFIEKFKPEFILLQCGADSLEGDPITQLNLTSNFHAFVTQQLIQLANQHCSGRLLAMGGGGYNLDNIKSAWNDVINTLVHTDRKLL
ncbi:MAG: acetoin utilization protein AcuC [Gammaproteobacteria bacterium]|nr:acetoin utilization protein AcuC [Gammaproteobacteria bacterium]